MDANLPFLLAALGAAACALPAIRRRVLLSRAKHRSLAGHARMARRVAAQLPYYGFEADDFFACDDADPAVVARRREAFSQLAELFKERFALSRSMTSEASSSLSDLQFTSAYRVPYPFSRKVRAALSLGSFYREAVGNELVDLDGNRFIDLSGSYGVNVFGHDFYRGCMEEGARRAKPLAVLLGGYHPALAFNVAKLREISGLDEVSFHMSGTEAVMQAVRLARYHTRRTHLVRFCGAYHGWWEDVQPGPGNPVAPRDTYTLKDMDPRSLAVLRSRRDVACVLVNPLQALHPNRNAPGDSSLMDSSREAGFDKAAYTAWLRRLREVCDERGIVLIFDEVFLGFRIARGGAQEYFGVRADLVTYGKTLGGGLPVGVVCGRARLMRRFRDDRPADICFARGTFNAHPQVMTSMQVFLEELDKAPQRELYEGLDERWDGRAASLNARLEAEDLPVRVANLSTVWTVCYTRASRYNWMLQFYLRAEGLALSWVGSGRLIFPLRFDDDDFERVCERFLAASRRMQADGWWTRSPELSNRSIKRQVLREMLQARLARFRPRLQATP